MRPPTAVVVRVRAGASQAVHRAEIAADGRVRIDEIPTIFDVAPISPGVYRVTDGDRSWQVAVAGPRDARMVFIDGDVYDVEIAPEGSAPRKARAGHDDAAIVPMPATVRSIRVLPGQAVRRGEEVLVLEAMKMELPVRAPRDGTVRAVHCQEGDQVQPGARLIEFE